MAQLDSLGVEPQADGNVYNLVIRTYAGLDCFEIMGTTNTKRSPLLDGEWFWF
jgi:hypothetical protein